MCLLLAAHHLRHALRERLISSIRADPNVLPQTIIFTPPLTLILGENGSGKTTIIEVRFPMISARHSANLRIVQGRALGVPFPATSHVCYSHRHCSWLRAVLFLPIQVSSAKVSGHAACLFL